MYLFVFRFFSCKNETKEIKKKETVVSLNERVKISVDDEKFYYPFNDDKKDRKASDIFGKYTIDRFKNQDQSVVLDGVSDYIEIFNEPELNPKKEITISVWYKPESFKGVGTNCIVWKGFQEYKKPFAQYYITATGNLYPKYSGCFKFALSIKGSLYHILSEPNSWFPEKWYNIVGTYNGNQMRLYVNGKLLGKET